MHENSVMPSESPAPIIVAPGSHHISKKSAIFALKLVTQCFPLTRLDPQQASSQEQVYLERPVIIGIRPFVTFVEGGSYITLARIHTTGFTDHVAL